MVFEGADSAAHGADTAPKRLLPPTSSASTIQRHCNAGPAQSLRRGLKRRAVAAAGCRNQVTHVHQQKRARDALPSDECGRWGKRAVAWEGGRPAALRRVVAEQSHTSGLLLEVQSSSNSVRPSSQRHHDVFVRPQGFRERPIGRPSGHCKGVLILGTLPKQGCHSNGTRL